MSDTRVIKRYNAYYKGWCLAFGEHTADYDDAREISWLFGEQRVGLILSTNLLKRAQHELLGHQSIPELLLSDQSVAFNSFDFSLQDNIDLQNVQRFKEFLLGGDELHMFLSNHLIYPSKTRILTFSTQKPLIIMYKEMQPLKLTIQ
ncbi:MAG: hypothetical protein N0C81_00345 [Candidatus Thiodiazotropha lotti]|uniref:Uncharacterized protein n=1 Tax=Candidatus Thiodiazotropha lotti TaxID=2792787 RepID=A0A9E4N1N9_9GAMM|nr:hypothetical protein [Candidatus Thiodiazotropha lotti]ODC00473.1 hypothetical protein A3197_09045 [Candidatus Thiodiazotropha endoloripes]MCG7922788.1 hypothetical protein [Candidatus Thiodiazotropha lotti]MCG7928712.1 hypothetical protein [Candidatus Thiodiazotropha lotti]MCG7941236.1 hypothetical protein [Candidatus Thiodiazotropha lotti]